VSAVEANEIPSAVDGRCSLVACGGGRATLGQAGQTDRVPGPLQHLGRRDCSSRAPRHPHDAVTSSPPANRRAEPGIEM